MLKREKKKIDLNWSNVAITTTGRLDLRWLSTVFWKVGKYKYLHSQNGRFWKRKIRETGEAFLRRRISSLQNRTRAKRYTALTDFTCPSSRYLFWQHNGCMNKMMTQNHFQTASRIHLFIIETFCISKVLFSFFFFFFFSHRAFIKTAFSDSI